MVGWRLASERPEGAKGLADVFGRRGVDGFLGDAQSRAILIL